MADRPEPVLDMGKIAAAVILVVGALMTLLVTFGIDINDDQKQAIVATITGVFTLIAAAGPYLAALKARMKVTPLEAPKTAEGVDLVPVA